MIRVLFVDDEPQLLEALRLIMRRLRRDWDMAFASSGEEALRQLREGPPVDVLVSDMRMPGMDGATLLARVKEEFPRVIRIILSGHSEQEAILRAVPVSHQFLAKPCSGAQLRAVIESTHTQRDRVTSEHLEKIVAYTDSLPSLPRVCLELSEAIRDPEVTMKRVARIVEGDAAVSAKLLKMANSGYFGFARTVTEVDVAVTYLGMHLVRALANTSHLFAACEASANGAELRMLDALHAHGLLTGRIASRIAPPSLACDAFAAAILHDVGKLVLLGQVEHGAKGFDPSTATLEEERERFGVTHTEIGSYLTALWGLPGVIVDAVAYHHAPLLSAETSFGVTGAVHVASEFAHGVSEVNARALVVDLDYLVARGVEQQLDVFVELADQEVAAWNMRSAG